MRIVRIKALCKRAGIAKLTSGTKGTVVEFYNDTYASPQGLAAFLQGSNRAAKIKDNRIVVAADLPREGDRVKAAFAVARDLAQHAKAAA